MAAKKTLTNPDLTLPEVKKPAGWGVLVAVLIPEQNKRELWFQNEDTVRVIRIDAPKMLQEKPFSLLTKGRRST